MATFVLRRLAAGVVLVFVITTVAYALLYATSGNIARNVLGDLATEEQVSAKAAELGVDRPLLTQYGDWLADAVRGQFGRSWYSERSVTTAVADRLPVTLSMVLVAITVTALISVVLGMTAAMRGGWVDRILQVVSVTGFSVPNFWLALILVLTFALGLGWFPATGYVSLLDDPANWARSLVLPVTALAVSATASAAQQIRGAVRDTLELDFVRTLESRGLSHRSVLFRHVLRNAAPPALTVLSLQFIGLLGGAVVVENVFGIRGLGTLTVQSAIDGDIPQLMAIVVVSVILVVLVNLVIDIANGWLNPKARLQ
jgi:peptide/nickel transport system permease protein